MAVTKARPVPSSPWPDDTCPCCGGVLLGTPSQRRCPTTSRTVRPADREVRPAGWSR